VDYARELEKGKKYNYFAFKHLHVIATVWVSSAAGSYIVP